MFLSVFTWKCAAPIRDFIVPNGYSTVGGDAHLIRVPIEVCLHGLKDALKHERAGLCGFIEEPRAGLTACKKNTSEKTTNAHVVDSRQGGR
jgi:hypothetical protein